MEVHSEAELKEHRGKCRTSTAASSSGGDYDKQVTDLPDEVSRRILRRTCSGLFYRYNFTVDRIHAAGHRGGRRSRDARQGLRGAGDGRQEKGSYYTPRPVVAFMCREALKHYLAPVIPDPAALTAFVDERIRASARSRSRARRVRKVKVCDPACGSGAIFWA